VAGSLDKLLEGFLVVGFSFVVCGFLLLLFCFGFFAKSISPQSSFSVASAEGDQNWRTGELVLRNKGMQITT